jgi:hypothetical protein
MKAPTAPKLALMTTAQAAATLSVQVLGAQDSAPENVAVQRALNPA